MILTFDDLALRFNDRTDIKGKIRREVKAGRLTQIRRGLYETDAKADGKYLAGAIYGPSYLSFDYVLSMCSLIPEAILRTYTSVPFVIPMSMMRLLTGPSPDSLFTFTVCPQATSFSVFIMLSFTKP